MTGPQPGGTGQGAPPARDPDASSVGDLAVGAVRVPAFLADDPRRPGWWRALIELCAFARKEAWSCLFPLFIFAMLGATHVLAIPGIPRYDLLLALCIGMQVAMYATRMESADEVLVILVFHALGFCLELWKVHIGSWSYPTPAWTAIGGVPLFGGFLYASVASYVCQAWRRFDLHLTGWPSTRTCCAIALAIYANFFTNHVFPDARLVLFALVVWCFHGSWVHFSCNRAARRMPIILAFVLIGLFIWLAENIATYLGAWRYPNQHHGWHPVYWQKLTSWHLLVIVSIVIIAELKRLKGRRAGAHQSVNMLPHP
jgi:uncharacterized membrane protein YoaT (DUF817 family)